MRADNGRMTAVLVAYAGRHGGTRQIAEVIAAELGETGLTVDVAHFLAAEQRRG